MCLSARMRGILAHQSPSIITIEQCPNISKRTRRASIFLAGHVVSAKTSIEYYGTGALAVCQGSCRRSPTVWLFSSSTRFRTSSTIQIKASRKWRSFILRRATGCIVTARSYLDGASSSGIPGCGIQIWEDIQGYS